MHGNPDVYKCSNTMLCPAANGWFPIKIWNTRATTPGMIKTEESHQRVIDAVSGARKSWAKQATLPDGYVLVPVEPTIAMLDAGEKEYRATTLYSRNNVRNIYKAMIEAAE